MKKISKVPTAPAASAAEGEVDPRISLRLDEDIALRFARVVKASRRTKTSVIEECLEKVLPDLEKQYKQAA